MQIKNMFEKQIDRDIKGVIKVGQSDEENVFQELDEYACPLPLDVGENVEIRAVAVFFLFLVVEHSKLGVI